MLICAILWIIWVIWAVLCFTVLKDIDKNWHAILFWSLLIIAVGSVPIWLLVKHPLYFYLLCRH